MTREERIQLAKSKPGWMYEFDLGDGIRTPLLDEELRSIHQTRERMIMPLLDQIFPAGLSGKRCLDVACNEGYFSHLLYQRGAAVKGFDIREMNIQRALAVRDALGYEATRLVFEIQDFMTNREEDDAFEVVLFLGLLYHLENPMGAIRLLRRITRSVCVIETQLTRQTTPIISGWGQTGVTLELPASLALYQEHDMEQNNLAAAGSLSFIPNVAALKQMLFFAGFSKVLQVAAPSGSNPQYSSGDRGVFFALK